MKLISKIACYLGYHQWTWKWDGKPISLSTGVPRNAKCTACGCTYDKKYKEKKNEN